MTKKIKIEENILVKMLSDRNSKALEILYDNYSAAMYGVIHRIIQNDAVAPTGTVDVDVDAAGQPSYTIR